MMDLLAKCAPEMVACMEDQVEVLPSVMFLGVFTVFCVCACSHLYVNRIEAIHARVQAEQAHIQAQWLEGTSPFEKIFLCSPANVC